MLLTSEVNNGTIQSEKRDRNERKNPEYRARKSTLTRSPFKKVENMTRILLYSDEPILAKGLESVLRQVEGFELLPACSTVAGVVDQVAHGGPDLVLMDLTPEITFAVLS